MSADDYQVENIHRYSRKSYSKNKEEEIGSINRSHLESGVTSFRAEKGYASDSPRAPCACGTDPDGEIASILHKKCAVITLAEQQLQRLLNESDKLFCDNSGKRSIYKFLLKCGELLKQHNIKCQCLLLTMGCCAFFVGVLMGASSCSSFPGRYDSPILSCVERLFNRYAQTKTDDTFRSIT